MDTEEIIECMNYLQTLVKSYAQIIEIGRDREQHEFGNHYSVDELIIVFLNSPVKRLNYFSWDTDCYTIYSIEIEGKTYYILFESYFGSCGECDDSSRIFEGYSDDPEQDYQDLTTRLIDNCIITDDISTLQLLTVENVTIDYFNKFKTKFLMNL